ncbi:MAG: flavin reductase [Flavobacteriales bacterium]
MNIINDLNEGFRLGMRTLAAGVSVISAVNGEERAAMTVSSLTSVSDQPPSLLVCVNKATRMDTIIENADRFVVNILASHQQDVSNICARAEAGEQRFETGDWAKDELSGQYYLADALTVFICEKTQTVEYGTHNVVFGNIIEVRRVAEPHQPLIYVNGSYLDKV